MPPQEPQELPAIPESFTKDPERHSNLQKFLIAGIIIFFVLTNYASGWEHNIYKRKKRELEILKDKLENEE